MRNFNFWLFFITCFLIDGIILQLTPKKDEKFFEMLLDRFEVEKQNKSICEFYLKIRKSNKQRLFFGYIDMREPIGNNFVVEIKSLKKQGGEYRYMPYKIMPTPFCDLVINDDYCYSDIAANSDLPKDIKDNCPLAPGNYSVNGITCSFDNLPKLISSGDYGAEIIFSLNNNVIAIYRIYGSVVIV